MSSTNFSSYSSLDMGVTRVNAGIKVLPDLKRALQRQATREDKTLSKLGEVLLQWAFEQLQMAGDSFALKKWEARPGSHPDLVDKAVQTDAEVFNRGTKAPGSKRKKAG